MKKKIAGTLACLLALNMSVAAYAETPKTTVAADENGGTSITITDVTPREEEKDESKTDYTVGGYYPVEIQTAEEDGVRLLVKTYVVPQGTDPQALITEGLTRRGVEYQVSDILRRELSGTSESKTVSQTVTTPADTDQVEELLSVLTPTVEYREDGFSGSLVLDRESIVTKTSDTKSYSYTMKDTREYTGLDRSDPYFIPKTAEKNGVTLKLSDIDWTPVASSADNGAVPSLFKATALYTGTAWGSKPTEFLVTASYTGEAVKVTDGDVAYSIIYEEVPEAGFFADFNWTPIIMGMGVVVLIAGAAWAVLWLVCRRRDEAQTDHEPMNAYANRPAMDLPDILDEMDRGLEESKR